MAARAPDEAFGPFGGFADIRQATRAMEAASEAVRREGTGAARPGAAIRMVSIDGLLNAAANDHLVIARCALLPCFARSPCTLTACTTASTWSTART
jgi:hypothetical protein